MGKSRSEINQDPMEKVMEMIQHDPQQAEADRQKSGGRPSSNKPMFLMFRVYGGDSHEP